MSGNWKSSVTLSPSAMPPTQGMKALKTLPPKSVLDPSVSPLTPPSSLMWKATLAYTPVTHFGMRYNRVIQT